MFSSLKLKRQHAAKIYRKHIDHMYGVEKGTDTGTDVTRGFQVN
jgi:hypothetical protein